MNRLLISTALAGLLTAMTPGAFAQDHRDAGHGGGAPHPQGGGAPHAAPAPHGPAGGPPGGDHHGGGGPRPMAGGAGHDFHPGPAGGPAMHQDNRGPSPAAAMRGPGPGAGMRGPAPGAAMRGPGPARGASFNAYRRNFNAPRHFHAEAYRRPSGWYARRWTYGEILPALFWTNSYWINDFDDYGLMPPPPGTVWVRDGDDALLIDQYSGEIVQVDYGVFY